VWWYCTNQMAAIARGIRRCYSVEAELAVVALVLVAWQAVRIPLEGGVATSLDHAQDVLRLEGFLSIDVEGWMVDAVNRANAEAALDWLYKNIHVPVLFGFVAAARLLAPDRYPRIRTTFVVSFLPAVLVIGLYPLAPPHWLPRFGFGVPPGDSALTGGTGELFHNTTAAAASQHFGFAVFVAATSIWLFPRSRLAWATIAYPALVFVVILGTGNHYVLDCIVGTLTFAFAAAVASVLHGTSTPATVPAQRSGVAGIAVGYGLIAWGIVSLDLLSPGSRDNLLPYAVLLGGVVAALVVPRLAAREALAESG
jgi:PAP2 superfamily